MNSQYIQLKQINLDLQQLQRDCRRINTRVVREFSDKDIVTDKRYQATLAEQLNQAPQSSKLHEQYNVFSFPYDGINALYREICSFFKEVCTYDQPYYVHAWLNYGEKGSAIPWHNHWGALSGLKETYVCSYYVNAEPSKTIYKFPNGYVDERTNQNNTITIYEDLGDIHQAEPWQGQGARISISMDFVPMKYIRLTPYLINTWIPVL